MEKEQETGAEVLEETVAAAEPQEEQEFLDRLASFGEGYYDFTTFREIFGEPETP